MWITGFFIIILNVIIFIMKLSFNKYWIFMALCIIGNIIIFTFMSDKLETYVTDSIIENQY